jgi:peptidoglycan hydrolase CwlO-like protein
LKALQREHETVIKGLRAQIADQAGVIADTKYYYGEAQDDIQGLRMEVEQIPSFLFT